MILLLKHLSIIGSLLSVTYLFFDALFTGTFLYFPLLTDKQRLFWDLSTTFSRDMAALALSLIFISITILSYFLTDNIMSVAFIYFVSLIYIILFNAKRKEMILTVSYRKETHEKKQKWYYAGIRSKEAYFFSDSKSSSLNSLLSLSEKELVDSFVGYEQIKSKKTVF